jgi:hypothetical protein
MVLEVAAEVEILPHILHLLDMDLVLVDLLLVLDRVELVLVDILDLKQLMVLHS